MAFFGYSTVGWWARKSTTARLVNVKFGMKEVGVAKPSEIRKPNVMIRKTSPSLGVKTPNEKMSNAPTKVPVAADNQLIETGDLAKLDIVEAVFVQDPANDFGGVEAYVLQVGPELVGVH